MFEHIVPLMDVQKDEVQRCGGKAVGLGVLTRMGATVPPGFCVVGEAFPHILAENQLSGEIYGLAETIDFDDYEDVEKKCGIIRQKIQKAVIPPDLEHGIRASYEDLINPENKFVAVRSSVAVRGTDTSSFPGMMDTFHFVLGADDVVQRVRDCWASLWSARAAHVRKHKGIPHEDGIIAPVIQLMVNPETAGVLFTANPVTKNLDEIVIEANWGLGESVVSGKSMNDYFVLGKDDLDIQVAKVSKKTVMMTMDYDRGAGRIEKSVPEEQVEKRTLSDKKLIELGTISKKIEKHFGFQVDIEWAYQLDQLYILQTRKISNL